MKDFKLGSGVVTFSKRVHYNPTSLKVETGEEERGFGQGEVPQRTYLHGKHFHFDANLKGRKEIPGKESNRLVVKFSCSCPESRSPFCASFCRRRGSKGLLLNSSKPATAPFESPSKIHSLEFNEGFEGRGLILIVARVDQEVGAATPKMPPEKQSGEEQNALAVGGSSTAVVGGF